MTDPDFFGGIEQHPMPWHDRVMQVPAFYRRMASAQVALAVPTHNVLPLLPSSRLHPLRIAPTRTLMVVSALRYGDTDIGPYDELMVVFPCTLDEPSPQFSGTFRHPPDTLLVVQSLLVTTEIAMQAGNELLATRKQLADIRVEDEAEWWSCDVAMDGQAVLSLAVRKGTMQPAQRRHLSMLSVRGDRLLRWGFTIGEHEACVSRHGRDARVSWGPHSLGRELQALEPGPLLECQFSPQMQGILAPVSESLAR